MTPTTKAALDAAEKALNVIKPYISRVAWDGISADPLHLIAEARKAEESDTARLDWLENQYPHEGMFGAQIEARDLVHHRDGEWSCGNNVLGGWFAGVTARSAIDTAMKSTASQAIICTACDEPIAGTVHYDVNQLPFDTDCSEDLCRAMASVPEGEK